MDTHVCAHESLMMAGEAMAEAESVAVTPEILASMFGHPSIESFAAWLGELAPAERAQALALLASPSGGGS